MSTVSATTKAPFSVGKLDHVVVQCGSVDATVEWYTKYLGMKHDVFDSITGPRHALSFGQQKLNLHAAASPWKPHAQAPVAGSADLCFILEGKSTSVEQVKQYWEKNGLEIVEGVVERTGAVGKLRSVYTRDPDGNLVEVSMYEEVDGL